MGPCSSTTSRSVSTRGRPRILASRLPVRVFPAPGAPISTTTARSSFTFGGGGSGQGNASQDGEGEDEFVFQISKDEYLDLLFEDLALPNLKKNQFKKSEDGTSYITIRDSKTMAGIREIPLHSFIAKYMDEFSAGKSDKIFKYEEVDGKGAGNAVGKKFARNVEAAKLTREKLVFHSLRKFVNNELLKNRVSLEHRCQFIGHELDNVNVAVYSEKIEIDSLAESVFPTFDKILSLIRPDIDVIRIEFSSEI